jgi:WD40 repeat protein
LAAKAATTAHPAAPSFPSAREDISEMLAHCAAIDGPETLARMAMVCKGWWAAAIRAPGYRTQLLHGGHTGGVGAMAMLPDGMLATGSGDNTVVLWEVKMARQVRRLTGHSGEVNGVAALDGGQLASCSMDSTIRIWVVQTGLLLRALACDSSVYGLLALPAGQLASSSRDTTVRVWDVETGQQLRTLEGHTHPIYSLVTLPGGLIASGSGDKAVRIWNAATGQNLLTMSQAIGYHGSTVSALAPLPGGLLAVGSAGHYTHHVQLRNMKTGQLVRTLAGHTGGV